jgi:peptide/nickel transport system permease protein
MSATAATGSVRQAAATARWVARRAAHAVPAVIGIAAVNFLLLQLAPGDAADVLAGESGSATAEYVAALKAQFGLDQPVWVQFLNYLGRLLQLDLGYSFRHNQTVLALIGERLPATLLLMVTAVALAFSTGIGLGVLASRFVHRWTDSLISMAALLVYATPVFWVGLMMIVLMSVQLGWLPSGGMESVGAGMTGWRRAADIAAHLVMPATTLALFYTAFYTRMMRASMLEVFNQDYVTTARAKGLSEARVMRVHVLRNAMLPMVTMLGLQVGTLLGGSVLVETVFAWPGLGRLGFEAVLSRDFNLLLGILLLSSLIVMAANIAVDMAYAWLDPRIELK